MAPASPIPKGVDLFPARAIGKAAHPAPEKSDAALAQERLNDWAQQWDATRRARVGDTTPQLQEMARRFESWFMPKTESIAAQATFGLGNAAIVARWLNGAAGYMGPPSQFSGGLPALIAQVEVCIEVRHDRDGLPVDWKVANSSGDPAFDEAALAAIEDGMNWSQKAALLTDRPAKSTEWSFEARAYRYFVVEYVMDPGLVARGSDLGEYDDGLGKTQVLRRARLLAVAYWPGGGKGPNPSSTGHERVDEGPTIAIP